MFCNNVPFLTSYHRLSLKYHPEKNKSPGGSQKFDELAEAYDVLSHCKCYTILISEFN